MKIIWFIVLMLVTPPQLWAQEVILKDGNVYFRTAQANVVQMTTTGLDFDPSLSPDGKSIVFIRDTPNVLVNTGAGDVNATELWLMNINTKKADRLIRGRNAPKIEKTLGGIESPRFSPDGSTIYFISAAWATSGSIQKLSLDTKKVRFMIDGVTLEVVLKGKYRGFLLIDRALLKFDKKGDSLGRDEYLWLVSPDGKPVREIGLAEGKAATNFREKHLK